MVKFKNPAAPAVKREAEEDWGKGKWPLAKAPGAQFEVSIDGMPRTYRDRKVFAIEAAHALWIPEIHLREYSADNAYVFDD